MSFRLAPGQLAFMETFGYLSVPGLLKDRLQGIEDAFEELMTSRGGRSHEGRTARSSAPRHLNVSGVSRNSSNMSPIPWINHDGCKISQKEPACASDAPRIRTDSLSKTAR